MATFEYALYTRDADKDYRWAIRPEVMGKIGENLIDLADGMVDCDERIQRKKLLFGINQGEYICLMRSFATEDLDYVGRQISSLEGMIAKTDSNKIVWDYPDAVLHLLEMDSTIYDRYKNGVSNKIARINAEIDPLDCDMNVESSMLKKFILDCGNGILSGKKNFVIGYGADYIDQSLLSEYNIEFCYDLLHEFTQIDSYQEEMKEKDFSNLNFEYPLRKEIYYQLYIVFNREGKRESYHWEARNRSGHLFSKSQEQKIKDHSLTMEKLCQEAYRIETFLNLRGWKKVEE